MAAFFRIKRSSDGQFMFNLRAPNNEVILTSERYTRKESALNGVDSVRKNAGNDKRFIRKVASNKQDYFVMRGANHRVIGRSERYSSAAMMEKGIAAVKRYAAAAKLVDEA
jgi:hypothetical protein